jgi:hypothetical protein
VEFSSSNVPLFFIEIKTLEFERLADGRHDLYVPSNAGY